MKLGYIQKIVLTAMFLALNIVLTRFLQIIPFPLLRISAGPSMIIFSSIFLGPIPGMIVGGLGDLLGILLYNPVAGVFNINPLISLVYVLYGLLPYFLVKFIKLIKGKFSSRIILSSLLLIVWGVIIAFTIVSDTITMFNVTYTFNLVGKILLPVLSFVMLALIQLLIFFVAKNIEKQNGEDNKVDVYSIAFAIIVVEIFITLVLNSLVKSFVFSFDFWLIFFPQSILLLITIPGYTLIVSYLLNICYKYMKLKGYEQYDGR